MLPCAPLAPVRGEAPHFPSPPAPFGLPAFFPPFSQARAHSVRVLLPERVFLRYRGGGGGSLFSIPTRSLRVVGIFSTFFANKGTQRKGPLAGTGVPSAPGRGGASRFLSPPPPFGLPIFFFLFSRKRGPQRKASLLEQMLPQHWGGGGPPAPHSHPLPSAYWHFPTFFTKEGTQWKAPCWNRCSPGVE